MRIFALSLGLILSFGSALAQDFRFMLEEELSSKLVREIYQDSDGFIWITTDNGLNRFDGNKVVSYSHDINDPSSLGNNMVVSVFDDQKGSMYVGSYKGIQLYDKKTNSFPLRAMHHDGSKLFETVNGFCRLPDGSICSFGDNVWLLHHESGRLLVDSVRWDISTADIYRIGCDNEGYIWALKRNDGLYRIRNNHARLICPYNNDQFSIYDIRLVEGKPYIISSDNDIYRFISGPDRIERVNAQTISKASVRDIQGYGEGYLLICTDGDGLKLVNCVSGEVSPLPINIPLLSSSHLKVHHAIYDNMGNLWIGLHQKGVAMIATQQSEFGYFGYKSFLNNIIGNCTISSLCPDTNGDIWVGSDGDGIYRIKADRSTTRHYPSYSDGGNVPSIIKTIYSDSNGNLWIGTYGNGCGYISRKNDQYVSLEKTFNRSGKAETRIYDITEDNDKRLWIATLGSGTFCYDLRTSRLVKELSFYADINLWQTSILYSSANKVYVGTFDGLFCIDLDRDTISPQLIMRRSVINTIYEDSAGNIWVGDSEGLCCIDKSGTVRCLTEADGVPSLSVNSINEDQQRNLWLATNNGIIRYDPSRQINVRFTSTDGLKCTDFSKTHSFTDKDGRIWFGGDYGITFFHPSALQNAKQEKRHVRIIDFYINNQPINTTSLSGGRPVSQFPAYMSKEFNLASGNNTFQVEFGTLELDTPNYAEYQYSIDDGEWTTIQSNSKTARFKDLDSGSHLIRYRVRYNQYVSEAESFTVTIQPYWWASIWAYLAYVVALVAAILMVLRYLRLRHLARIKIQKNQRAMEINNAKLQFFTNISHEIKTPLSLIVSPLQKLIATDHDAKRQDAYQTMFRNTKMLIQLVNQLIDIRKIDNGRLSLSFQKTEVISLIQDICTFFDAIVVEKGLDFSFHHSQEKMLMWVDANYFDMIIMNLISNAVKYTPNNGSVTVSIEQKLIGGVEQAVIEVADTGIGIREEDRKHIFDRFYIASNNQDHLSSNGIGLHLTRSLVRLHHGNIEVKDNDNRQGIRFVVTLPVGTEHLATDVNAPTHIDHQLTMLPETLSENDEKKVKVQSSKTLHIIDDDLEILKYLRKELATDFHIETSRNGLEALQKIFKNQPDIIICDVMMPEMDGLTLCRKIKQNTLLNHIPIILLTAKSDEDTNLQGLRYGADIYITKPFYIEVLRRTALNLVNMRAHLQNIYSHQQTQDERLLKMNLDSPNKKLLDRIMNVINNNISNPDLSIDMLCDEVGISRAHIYRKLKELTNQSGRDFIKNVRLKYAEQLLLEGNYSIGFVAEKVGFSNAGNFSSAFKEKYGCPPLQWRERQRKASQE